MKTLISIISILVLSLGQSHAGTEGYLLLEKFHSTKGTWDDEVDKESTGKASVQDCVTAFDSMMNAWGKVPALLQNESHHELNRLAYTMAELSTNSGKYGQALNYLNEEMRNQYQESEGRKVLFSGQNRNFYRNVVRLEATVLGHLGPNYHVTGIDYYLMPVGHTSSGGLSNFVAMEETDSDEEYDVTIPPFPKNEGRKILYLVSPDSNGNYGFVNSVQLIGLLGKETQISVSKGGGAPLVTLTGITHTVELKNGIPFRYVPVSASSVRYNVLPYGFRQVQ